MRRLMWVYAVLVALAMVMPAGALGQAPDFRERVSDDSVDPDFCGTGVSVDVHDEFLIQGWVTDTTIRSTFNGRTTYAYQGKTVVLHEVGRSQATVVEGTFDEPHTSLVMESGLRAQALIPGQGVATADHGLLIFRVTFVANPDPAGEPPLIPSEFEVLKDAGGHPGFNSSAFCEAATSYFGIPFDPAAE